MARLVVTSVDALPRIDEEPGLDRGRCSTSPG
jgi:hypothetical protein